MFNPYIIILALFTLGGIAMAAWGWRVLQQSKKVKTWPKTRAKITCSELPGSQFEAFSPKIEFCYHIDNQEYQQQQDFQGASLSREFCQQYVTKYPVGKEVEVFYNPAKPTQASLEPGVEKGDWMIFACGILAALLGLAMMVFGV